MTGNNDLLESIKRAQELVEEIGLDVSLSGEDALDELQTILCDMRSTLTAQLAQVEGRERALREALVERGVMPPSQAQSGYVWAIEHRESLDVNDICIVAVATTTQERDRILAEESDGSWGEGCFAVYRQAVNTADVGGISELSYFTVYGERKENQHEAFQALKEATDDE